VVTTPPRSQLDLFAAFIVDLPLRDQRDTMERPFFSLAKRRTKPIEYRQGDAFVRVSSPAAYGIATIYDADILIWAASQLTDARNRGVTHGPRISFMPYDLLRSIQRGTSGRDYAGLRAGLKRLAATVVETNVRVTDGKQAAMFHFIEAWDEQVDEKGNTRGMTIELARWFYEAVADGRVLAVHPDYFQLSSGLGRWLYRVARKHAGQQANGWAFTLTALHEKSGSTQRLSDFARDVRKLVAANTLPEYALSLQPGARGDEILHAIRRTLLASDHPAADRDLRQERGKRRTSPKLA